MKHIFILFLALHKKEKEKWYELDQLGFDIQIMWTCTIYLKKNNDRINIVAKTQKNK